jgi:hypothetical protein
MIKNRQTCGGGMMRFRKRGLSKHDIDFSIWYLLLEVETLYAELGERAEKQKDP